MTSNPWNMDRGFSILSTQLFLAAWMQRLISLDPIAGIDKRETLITLCPLGQASIGASDANRSLIQVY